MNKLHLGPQWVFQEVFDPKYTAHCERNWLLCYEPKHLNSPSNRQIKSARNLRNSKYSFISILVGDHTLFNGCVYVQTSDSIRDTNEKGIPE